MAFYKVFALLVTVTVLLAGRVAFSDDRSDLIDDPQTVSNTANPYSAEGSAEDIVPLDQSPYEGPSADKAVTVVGRDLQKKGSSTLETDRLIAYGEYVDGRELIRWGIPCAILSLGQLVSGIVIVATYAYEDNSMVALGGAFIGLGLVGAIGSTITIVAGAKKINRYEKHVQFDRLSKDSTTMRLSQHLEFKGIGLLANREMQIYGLSAHFDF